MQNDIEQTTRGRGNGKVIAGFILMIVGGVLLLNQIGGYIFPSWLFHWPMILILIGLYSGAKHNFRRPGAYLLIIIGGLFLLDDIIPGAHLSGMFWPVIIITIGIMMILGRNHKWDRNHFQKTGHYTYNRNWNSNYEQDKKWGWDKQVNPEEPVNPTADTTGTDYKSADYQQTYAKYSNDDYLDATSIFGSANRTVFTKTFKGGDITNIFGGAEIDFSQADFTGRVVIDVTQVFGGIKLIVPPHWHVASETVSLFAGFDDKRKQKADITSDKVLVLTGTSFFAGIEIRSYN